ncbi:beta-ketothiolase BktB [uncultured Candidatus Puniceispirillum sp.]|jgi:acetyl-CoA C-acetyltransferase|uniref:beta-ketothiolase BktB n=2 Tax=Candidatus Puniceispirillum TaxID=767891 RepID=UPI002A6CC57D|nr:beta-ketothiolase BktB [Candidatus Puniceispirillum sp.]
MSESVVILGGKRSAIGKFGGALAGIAPTELGSFVTKAALESVGVSPHHVDHSVYGNVLHSEARDVYIARVIALEAGLPTHAPALTVNRLCGSGLQAIISAIQLIQLGHAKIAIGGGVESMSRAGYLLPKLRFGTKMGDATAIDMMLASLHDPFGHGHMGITAENIANKFGVSRDQQDAFAQLSQERAAHAIAEGRFKEQIVGIDVGHGKKTSHFDTDEHPRATTIEDLAGLRTVFKEDGSVTAGNASGINDGAAAVVLANEKDAVERGLKPMARVLSYGFAAVPPEIMGVGPVPASKMALDQAGLSASDLDVIESNEAFAAQACYVSRELGLDPAKVNPNGGAIALGHPVGATGAILTLKLLHELRRIGGRYGLVTLCIGGGQGISMVVEAL